jgi:hypothetical protein
MHERGRVVMTPFRVGLNSVSCQAVNLQACKAGNLRASFAGQVHRYQVGGRTLAELPRANEHVADAGAGN